MASLPREVGGVPGRGLGRGSREVGELQKDGIQDLVQPTQDVICGEPEHLEAVTR